MNPAAHPAIRHSAVAVLLSAVVFGASLLPLSGAESKTKRSSSKEEVDATPRKKKKASASPTPKKKSGSTDDEQSSDSTPRKKGAATPSSKTKTAESGPVDEPSEDGAKSKEPAKKSASDEKEPSSTPVKATPKATPSSGVKKKGSATKDVPGQPATDLPKKDESASGLKPDSAEPKSADDTTEKPGTLPKQAKVYAPNVALTTDELLGFTEQPARVQKLIEAAMELSRQKLTYTYGSAEPSNGGMDCSGAIYYLLRQQGFRDVPRDASGQYVWARKTGQFFAVVSKKADSFEFGDLLPGDLLFWSGTYNVDRDPPVTHTMIYLGVQKKRGQHVMWGSSDGRTYDGKARWGVSVFDFKMPRADRNNGEPSKADFLGYARIPGLRERFD